MKLEKFNYSSGKKSRWFLYGFIMCAILMVLVNLFFSQAKYLNTESIKIVEGTISYKPNELNIVAVNIENDNGEYTYSENIPTSGYYLDDSKSYCEVKGVKDNSILIQYSNNKLAVSDITKKGTRCYAYFNKSESMTCVSGASACETIMENTDTIGERTDFYKTATATTTGIIYQAEDDYGTSYYYAGAPTDNWVKFAGFYWRIIRINGDGTIRMIYSGNEASGPVITNQFSDIGHSGFNAYSFDNMYVGYMYTSGQVHGIENASLVKNTVDTWYNNNLSSYASYIATGNGATFCNDRQPSTSHSELNGFGGTGEINTYYGGYMRLARLLSPSLKCASSQDRFNTSVGLITADEVAYAGGSIYMKNKEYYLNTYHHCWTMTPWVLENKIATVYSFGHGEFGGTPTHYNLYARPVINLKSDTTFSSGEGTIDYPYIVS